MKSLRSHIPLVPHTLHIAILRVLYIYDFLRYIEKNEKGYVGPMWDRGYVGRLGSLSPQNGRVGEGRVSANFLYFSLSWGEFAETLPSPALSCPLTFSKYHLLQLFLFVLNHNNNIYHLLFYKIYYK